MRSQKIPTIRASKLLVTVPIIRLEGDGTNKLSLKQKCCSLFKQTPLIAISNDQNQIKDVGTITPYSNLTATYSVS